MLAEYDLPLFLWPEAVAYAIYLKNCSPTQALDKDITPDEAFWKKKPDISALREFGSPCWVLRQDGQNQKLTSKSQPFQFTGLSDELHAWRYYNPESRKIQTSQNVTFNFDDEDTSSTEVIPMLTLKGEQKQVDQNELKSSSPVELPLSDSIDLNSQIESTTQSQSIQPTSKPAKPISPPHAWKTHVPSSDPDPEPNPDTATFAFLSIQDTSANEPLTVAEAQSCPDWPKWKEAMNAKIDQLKKLNTYRLTECPPDCVPITNKWVYCVKRNADGNIIRYKA
ncbi:hypothetical protein GYMLUDRAFT_245800 [Collybiopsis luxurians FD-317 M1]|uniref:Retroviral polymerase SH3-like domain-containing protein n=1 Tax=Collybiopsis luxurians FD-317 M1 TaxID=944289 RepID=A0A0D0B5Q8_9AGAR|nr:hypothetical protein GYMLUDRAFT_245800 [Collybiopsis luxurians FD-317 M1]